MQSAQRPLGVLLIGGLDSNNSSLSSVEVFSLENCSVPDLPEGRYNLGTFMTGWGSLAVCGGWLGQSTDCLVLNTPLRRWERGLLGNILGNIVLGVVSLDIGTYMVHPSTSSFLPSGEREWIAGPNPPKQSKVLNCKKF